MSNPLLDTSSLPRFDQVAPEHAVPALRELIAAHQRKLADLLDDPAPRNFASLVAPLEEMDHELSRVWSPISHLQRVLEDPAWRDAYNASLPLVTEHATELSQNQQLQQAYVQVDEGMPEDATPAMRMLIEQALRDFRLAGVALAEEQKTRYRELMQETAAAQARFDQNVQDATDAWHFHATRESQVAGLPDTVRERASEEARGQDLDGWWLKLDFPTYHAVMTMAMTDRYARCFTGPGPRVHPMKAVTNSGTTPKSSTKFLRFGMKQRAWLDSPTTPNIRWPPRWRTRLMRCWIS